MTWEIKREEGPRLDLGEVLAVYRSSGLGERRPVDDTDRMAAMVANANLIVTCRAGGALIGIARSVSDFSYVTYLSDIAVDRAYQRAGIGKALIAATRDAAPGVKIVLLSAPAATAYYPHLGFLQHNSAWVLSERT